MSRLSPIPSRYRVLCAAALARVIGHGSLVIAAPAPSASVVSITSAGPADLVLLNNGFDAGLRQGMVCRLTRGSTEIAEVLLAEVRPACSAALILSVAASQSIHAGDLASVKVLKSPKT